VFVLIIQGAIWPQQVIDSKGIPEMEGIDILKNEFSIVGKPPAAPTAAAEAHAVYDAVGIRLNQLPLTPERVYRALQNKDASRG
jgi:putative selenate reductase molybdopterin-binding subunit